MKASTFAATAAILGSVSAEGWDSWTGSSSDKPAKSTPVKPHPGKVTTTAEIEVDPSTWAKWSTTEKTPDVETKDPSAWAEWSTTKTPDAETTHDPSWSEWSKSSTDPSDDKSKNWSEWSTPVAETTTKDPNWSAWKPADPKSTITSTRTQWVTVTIFPVDGGKTWSQWNDPASKTEGSSWSAWSDSAVVSSTVTKTADPASWSQWASPVAAVVDPGCKVQVSLSYGQPVWFPTPVLSETVNSTSWAEWDAASSTPAVETQTQSWAAWTSDPVDPTSASSWGVWESTSTKPSEETTTESWGSWESESADPSTVTSWGVWQSTSTKPVEETTTSVWGEWSNTVEKVADPVAQTSWAEWSASTTSSSGSAVHTQWAEWKQDGNGISANGNKFGMTYSPYRADSGCKDAATVSADIAALAAKGFTSVRVYSTDCQTLENVGKAARDNKIKVILGVFIAETGTAGAQKQVSDIVAWAQWDLVELIVVGNEAVFGNKCSASDLAAFIGSSKAAFKGAGYTGAVSTTDELSVWTSQGSAWCDVVDVVTANLYAFFNPNTAAEDAGSFIQAQINELSQVCPGKEVYVMESGWPSAGQCNGKACPSHENQVTAIKGIQAAVGAKVVFFSFEDEAWKTPGQFGVEQHWGCGEVFGA